jgi:hypothetical protein
MRPYLAILVDSFREAVHSRVLWVVLFCITLVFALVFPLGLGEKLTTGLQRHEILSWPELAQRLATAGEEKKSPKPSPASYIWGKLDAETRSSVASLLPGSDGNGIEMERAINRLLNGLETQIDDPQWCESTAFKGVKLRREGRDLLLRLENEEPLTDAERRRLNRLVLEGTFHETIAFSPARSATLYYPIFLNQPLPLTRKEVEAILPGWIVLFTDYTFGIFGILVAMLMTASIIPQMFEPGSLHLLLSKPISRSLLFLTKFLGGCAFALVTVSYFALLLWLYLGMRLAVWDSRVVAAIPVYTFVFAVYYSVTALAGLWFRNTIVSVVLGILFWAVCFGTGLLKSGIQFFVIEQIRIQEMTVADDAVLALFPNNEIGIPKLSFLLKEFRPEDRTWSTVYRSQSEGPEPLNQSYPAVGPFYDAEHDQLVSIQGNRLRGNDVVLSVGPRSELWPRSKGAALPSGTVSVLMDSQSRIIAVTLDGIYRSTKNVAIGEEGGKVLGFSLPWGKPPAAFEQVSEGDWPFIVQPISMAIDPKSDDLLLYSQGEVAIWAQGSDGTYSRRVQRTLEGEEKLAAMCALAGGSALLAAEDGRLLVLDSQTLETKAELKPEDSNEPRQLRSSAAAKQIAVLFAHGVLYVLDADNRDLTYARAPGQGTISGIAYDKQGNLLVAHDGRLVSRCDPHTWASEVICRPQLSAVEQVYYYGVMPVYTTLPKPGELYRTLLYFLTGKKTEPAGESNNRPSAEPEFKERLNPWQPVWSGAIFLAVMLGIGCVYMERMEF